MRVISAVILLGLTSYRALGSGVVLTRLYSSADIPELVPYLTFLPGRYYWPFLPVTAHCMSVWNETVGSLPNCHLPESCPPKSISVDSYSFWGFKSHRVCTAIPSPEVSDLRLVTSHEFFMPLQLLVLVVHVPSDFLLDSDDSALSPSLYPFLVPEDGLPIAFDESAYPPNLRDYSLDLLPTIIIDVLSHFPGKVVRVSNLFRNPFVITFTLTSFSELVVDDKPFTFRTEDNVTSVSLDSVFIMELPAFPQLILTFAKRKLILTAVSTGPSTLLYQVSKRKVTSVYSSMFQTLPPLPAGLPLTTFSGRGYSAGVYRKYHFNGSVIIHTPLPLYVASRITSVSDYLNLMYIFTHALDFVVLLVRELLLILVAIIKDWSSLREFVVDLSALLQSLFYEILSIINTYFKLADISILAILSYLYTRDSYITVALVIVPILFGFYTR
jgi:hypothetical protein